MLDLRVFREKKLIVRDFVAPVARCTSVAYGRPFAGKAA